MLCVDDKRFPLLSYYSNLSLPSLTAMWFLRSSLFLQPSNIFPGKPPGGPVKAKLPLSCWEFLLFHFFFLFFFHITLAKNAYTWLLKLWSHSCHTFLLWVGDKAISTVLTRNYRIQVWQRCSFGPTLQLCFFDDALWLKISLSCNR